MLKQVRRRLFTNKVIEVRVILQRAMQYSTCGFGMRDKQEISLPIIGIGRRCPQKSRSSTTVTTPHRQEKNPQDFRSNIAILL